MVGPRSGPVAQMKDILIAEGEWIVDNDESTTIEKVTTILVPVSEVEMVEFLASPSSDGS